MKGANVSNASSAVADRKTERVEQLAADCSFESALREWRSALGIAGVVGGRDASSSYGTNTAGIVRSIPATLIPRSNADVVAIVNIAAKHRVPLYPISTGRNWGYGCANPVTDGCAIVDLSPLNQIVAFDAALGLVTVQPGVTQRILAEYLDRNGSEFMVPVTGAGPDASILGNALERGYGLTPFADHFAAVTAIEAVLPNGEVYRSALAEAGGVEVDRAFKWGVGPYVDGLFAQGNFGIVTQATIALARRPERIEAFFFSVHDDKHLEAAVTAVREILDSAGGVTSSLNLMNARRVLSMVEKYPADRIAKDGLIPQAVVDELAARNQIPSWTGVGALYGTTAIVRAARGAIRKALRPFARRLVFATSAEVGFARKISAWIPFLKNSRAAGILERVDAFLDNVSGKPSDIALPLAYWKSGHQPRPDRPLNPARDGCGLLWYAPLVPMNSSRVREYVEMVERVCGEHGMEPLITLTSVCNRCFDSTVPLLFNKENSEECSRAHACYDALFLAGKRHGFLPYRLGVHAMQHMVDPEKPFWKISAALKRVVDPHEIIAPGRYSPVRKQPSR